MTTSQPTIVLVHGAFTDASRFAGVIECLEEAGHPVIAPPNPLRSLASDTESVRRRVAAIDGPVILVGHAYGGALISQAVDTLENVIGLVYLAAFALEIGESCLSVQDGYEPSLLASETSPTPYDAPGAPGGPDLFVTESAFREVICGDSPLGLARVMSATQRPLAAYALTERSVSGSRRAMPAWYLISEDDHSLATEVQLFLARRTHATIDAIEGSHTAFIAHPQMVAAFVLQAAEDFVSRAAN